MVATMVVYWVAPKVDWSEMQKAGRWAVAMVGWRAALKADCSVVWLVDSRVMRWAATTAVG